MKIALIVEGKTEKAFLPYLRAYLKARIAGNMPRLDVVPYDGRIPKEDKLRRVVENLLTGPRDAFPDPIPESAVAALATNDLQGLYRLVRRAFQLSCHRGVPAG
jgi:hypothetical protein